MGFFTVLGAWPTLMSHSQDVWTSTAWNTVFTFQLMCSYGYIKYSSVLTYLYTCQYSLKTMKRSTQGPLSLCLVSRCPVTVIEIRSQHVRGIWNTLYFPTENIPFGPRTDASSDTLLKLAYIQSWTLYAFALKCIFVPLSICFLYGTWRLLSCGQHPLALFSTILLFYSFQKVLSWIITSQGHATTPCGAEPVALLQENGRAITFFFFLLLSPGSDKDQQLGCSTLSEDTAGRVKGLDEIICASCVGHCEDGCS